MFANLKTLTLLGGLLAGGLVVFGSPSNASAQFGPGFGYGPGMGIGPARGLGGINVNVGIGRPAAGCRVGCKTACRHVPVVAPICPPVVVPRPVIGVPPVYRYRPPAYGVGRPGFGHPGFGYPGYGHPGFGRPGFGRYPGVCW
jgi:hypothetical protein